MIEAAVFDVGRVLYQWRLGALFEKLTADPAELDHVLSKVITEEWHFQHDAGRPLAEMVPERIAQFPGYERFLAAYATRFNETIPGPVPGSLEIVQELHTAGIPLHAITNFGAEFWAAFCPTAPIFDLFRDIVVSGEEKLVKPDPAIFALAARRFGHLPGAMLFIDDNSANVASARKFGWQAHLFVDPAHLRALLVERALLGEWKRPPALWRAEGSGPTDGEGGGKLWRRVSRCSAPGLRPRESRPWRRSWLLRRTCG